MSESEHKFYAGRGTVQGSSLPNCIVCHEPESDPHHNFESEFFTHEFHELIPSAAPSEHDYLMNCSLHGQSCPDGQKNCEQFQSQVQGRAPKLKRILDFVYRFPFNVNLLEVAKAVYGDNVNVESGYFKSKMDVIERRGLVYWYCDLDNENQKKVAKLMLERYGADLAALLK
jgi:hypothetical protein